MKIFYLKQDVNPSNVFSAPSYQYIIMDTFIYVRVDYKDNSLFIHKDYLLYYSNYIKCNKSYTEFITMLSKIEKG